MFWHWVSQLLFCEKSHSFVTLGGWLLCVNLDRKRARKWLPQHFKHSDFSPIDHRGCLSCTVCTQWLTLRPDNGSQSTRNNVVALCVGANKHCTLRLQVNTKIFPGEDLLTVHVDNTVFKLSSLVSCRESW